MDYLIFSSTELFFLAFQVRHESTKISSDFPKVSQLMRNRDVEDRTISACSISESNRLEKKSHCSFLSRFDNTQDDEIAVEVNNLAI